MRFRTAVTLALFGALIGGAPGAVAAPTASATTTTTYVDCSAPTPGRGTETSPLNSLTQLKSAFGPGRKVLLRRGSTCVGTVVINASGRAGADTLLGAYGVGKTPVIDAKASAHNPRSAIEVDNKSHFVIQDLTVRNGYFNDISVEAHNGEHITGVTIQRVTAQQNVWTGGANSVTKNMWVMGVGGISVMPCSAKAQISQVTINKVEASHTQHAGVQLGYHQLYPWSDFEAGVARDGYSVLTCFAADAKPYPHVTPRDGIKNAVIANWSLHDNDAMGIGVFGATDVVVRKNDLYRNGSGRNPNPTPGSNTMNGAGAWWDTTQNVTAEWNNAWGNREGWTGNDGTGLDADRNTVNSVIQNNYLHDNANYGVSVISAQNKASATIRNNVIAGNGRAFGSAPEVMVSSYDDGSGIPGQVSGLWIYGNTIFRASNKGDGAGIRLQAPFTTDAKVGIVNNIIRVNGAPYSFDANGNRAVGRPGNVVTHNLTHPNSNWPGDINGLPGLADETARAHDWPTGGLYRLGPTSPAIGRALPLSNDVLPGNTAPMEGLVDFWGVAVPTDGSPFAIGADIHRTIVPPTTAPSSLPSMHAGKVPGNPAVAITALSGKKIVVGLRALPKTGV